MEKGVDLQTLIFNGNNRYSLLSNVSKDKGKTEEIVCNMKKPFPFLHFPYFVVNCLNINFLLGNTYFY